MVKSIIKRIIVGVGVALALMFIKGNLMLDVQAMAVQQATPTSMYMVDGTTNQNMNQEGFTLTGINTPFYGREFLSAIDRAWFYFNFDDNSHLDISQPLDMHFILYSTFWSSLNQPYHVFIVDANHNAYTCVTESSIHNAQNNSQNTPLEVRTSVLNNVYCSNIALSHGTFKVYIGDNFDTAKGTLGMSKITIYKHGSNQAVVDAVNNNTNATNQVNDTLNDDSIDEENAEQVVEDLDASISTNSNVSDLITMPIRMFMSINSQMQESCSTFSLGSLFGHNLSLPCINLSNLLGSTLYGIIDVILCGMFALVVRKKVVDIFNNITSLKDRGNEFE